MKRLLFIFAFFSAASLSAQPSFSVESDSASLRDRKARKVRTQLVLGAEYNLSTSQFATVKRQDTLLFCRFDREGRPVEEFRENTGNKSASRLWARYDKNGRVVRMINAERDSTRLSYVITFTYDEKGRLLTEERFEKENGKQELYERYVYTYADNGPAARRERFGGRPGGGLSLAETCFFTYDARGRCTGSATCTPANDTTYADEAQYDAAGQVTQRRVYFYEADKLSGKRTRKEISHAEMVYDSTGRQVASRIMSREWRTGTMQVEADKQFVRDKNGRIVETRDGKTTRKFAYAPTGALQSETEYFDGTPRMRKTFTETYYQ
jgi:hypothetical protein